MSTGNALWEDFLQRKYLYLRFKRLYFVFKKYTLQKNFWMILSTGVKRGDRVVTVKQKWGSLGSYGSMVEKEAVSCVSQAKYSLF